MSLRLQPCRIFPAHSEALSWPTQGVPHLTVTSILTSTLAYLCLLLVLKVGSDGVCSSVSSFFPSAVCLLLWAMVSQFLLIAVKPLSHCVNTCCTLVFLLIDTSWDTSLLQYGATGNSASSHESSCRGGRSTRPARYVPQGGMAGSQGTHSFTLSGYSQSGRASLDPLSQCVSAPALQYF